MHITPDMVEQAYEFLRISLPFRRWKLPHPDTLEFCVTLHSDRFGHFDDFDGKREFNNISVSARHVKNYDTLIRTAAHEMVHLRQWQLGRFKGDHGPGFKRLAGLVCRHHGWDVETF